MTKPIHHITLTVTDVTTSVAWYEALFGPSERVEREGEGWRRTRMTWGAMNDMRIGVMSHDAAPEGVFSHHNRGLDHIGFDCATVEEVQQWATTARDPDNIPIEFFCAK